MKKLTDSEKEKIAKKALKDKKYMQNLIENLCENCDKRWPSFQVLNYISEKYPKPLYDKWEYFAELFRSGNSYTKYATIYILANMTKVDKENKFEKLFDDYFGEIETNRTVTAAQVAYNAGKIAKAKPYLQGKIIEKLFEIDKVHKGKQKELIKGYVISTFTEYYNDFKDKEKIKNYVKDQLNSKSPATKKRAKDFLIKWDK